MENITKWNSKIKKKYQYLIFKFNSTNIAIARSFTRFNFNLTNNNQSPTSSLLPPSNLFNRRSYLPYRTYIRLYPPISRQGMKP